MLKYKSYLILLLTILSQALFAQDKNQTIIPFQLTPANNIAIKAILNGKDTINLMFHTAANSLSLTEEATKKLTSLKFDGADSVKSWGGADNTSRFSKSNTLQIGNLRWDNIPIWENKNSGPQTDGKFGLELFVNKVIEIDFDKSIITLYAKLPSKIRNYQKLSLSFENEMMFLTANSEINGKSLPNKYLIHSGYSGTILFDDQFTANHKIDGLLKVVDEKILKDSFGNVLKTKKAILPVFQIGNQKLENVPVGFFTGALGRQKMSIIGGDLLKRFNMIIDIDRTYIYLKINHLKSFIYSNS